MMTVAPFQLRSLTSFVENRQVATGIMQIARQL
jgi:hypothetical protein